MEEQNSGIREPPVAGNGPDVAEQSVSRPLVRGCIQKHPPEFFDDASVEIVFDVYRAGRAFEVDDTLVPFDLFPVWAGHGKVLRSATDPRARIRTQGLAYGVFRILDEKEGDLMLLVVLCGDPVQLGVTAMRDKNVIQLHELVYLALVQMFQSPDCSVGRDAHDEQSAVPVRIGETPRRTPRSDLEGLGYPIRKRFRPDEDDILPFDRSVGPRNRGPRES